MRASHYRVVSISFVFLMACIVAGCGGGGGGGSFDPTPTPINRAPSVTIIEPQGNPYVLDVTKAKWVDIVVEANDPDGGQLNCVWTWSEGLVSPAEHKVNAGSQSTVRYTPPNHNGLYEAKVTVSDGELSASKTVNIEVKGHTAPAPTPGTNLKITSIEASPTKVAPQGDSTMTVTVDNPDNKTLTYAWTSQYGQVTGTSPTAIWTAPTTPGSYGVYVSVSDGDAIVSAGTVVMVAGAEGGLQGQYYHTYREHQIVKFGDLRLTRIDPMINFHWAKLSPDPSIRSDGFGARWRGFFKAEEAGTYVFRVYVDDGARMRIKDDTGQWIEVIPDTPDNWNDHVEGAWLPEEVVPVNLQGGNWYPLELDYFEGGGDAFIHLYWSIDDGPEVLVPQSALKPPA